MRTNTTNLLNRATLSCLILMASAVCSAASAQHDTAIEGFLPAPDQTGFSGFPSTRTPGAWGLDGTVALGYARTPLGTSASEDLIAHRFDATVMGQLGLGSRTALALRLPLLINQNAGDSASGTTVEERGLGNPAIEGRVRVLGAGVRPDGSAEDGFALAVRGIVFIPAGTSNTFYADDALRTELSLIGDIEAFGIGAGAQLAYRRRFDDVGDFDPPEDQVRLSLGLKLPLPLLVRAFPGKVQESALIEFDVGSSIQDPFIKRYTPLEGRLGYRIAIGDVVFSVLGGAGFRDAWGAADARAIAMMSYSPRTHDQDADGVPDDGDQCEHLAEDRDGFEDGDGCPEPDNDQDMILDEDDRCPTEAADMGKDDDEDGCTDR